jgi:hypothetical protein
MKHFTLPEFSCAWKRAGDTVPLTFSLGTTGGWQTLVIAIGN